MSVPASVVRGWEPSPLTVSDMLTVWDQGDQRHPVDRALLFLSLALPSWSWDSLARLPLGLRDGLLLKLWGVTFGWTLNLRARCPRCREQVEFAQDLKDVPLPNPPQDQTWRASVVPVQIHGVNTQIRPLTTLDVAQALRMVSLQPRAQPVPVVQLSQLLIRQALVPPLPLIWQDNPAFLDDSVLAGLSDHLDQVDPLFVITFPLDCPYCSHHWTPLLDVPNLLWTQCVNRTKAALYEVHDLAAGYGWTEHAILSISPSRRKFYRALIRGGNGL